MFKTEILFVIPCYKEKQSVKPITEFDEKQVIEVMEKRSARVKETCERYELRPGGPARNFIALGHAGMPKFDVFFIHP